MLNVFVAGYGKMGRMIVETIEQSDDMKVVMIADGTNYPNASTLQEHVNIIIDFSHPDSLTWIKPFILEHACAYACGATGHNDIQKRQVEELSSVAPVVFQVNFSLRVAALQEVLQMIASMLEGSFDMEAAEKYHNQKQDAPGGTVKMLVAAMNKGHTYREVHGRNGFVGKRQKEIGIHAVRGSTVAGEHDVYFFGDDEIFEIKHTANSRKIFVNEALRTACFAVTQKSGMYTMKDILFA